MSIFDDMVSDTLRELKGRAQTSVMRVGEAKSERMTLEARAGSQLESFRRWLNNVVGYVHDLEVSTLPAVERKTLIAELKKRMELV